MKPELVRFRKLAFDSKGTILFHSSSETVAVWNVTSCQLCYICPGYMIGVSCDDRTFLTRITADSFGAWEIDTGTELALEHVSPDTYQLHQRVIALARQRQLSLQVKDAFDAYSFPVLHIPHGPYESSIENWGMSPNDQYVVAILGGSDGGFDWSRGYCIEWGTGTTVFEFEASACLTPTPICFSAEHQLLISGGVGCFWLYELVEDFPYRKVRLPDVHPYVPESGGSIVSVNPKNHAVVAVNSTEPTKNTLSLIQLVDIAQSSVKVNRTIQESMPIVDIQFHPNGEHLVSLLTNGEIHIWDAATGRLEAVLPNVSDC